ncbi:MAG: PASTA domain-containing protein [Candidatus Marinimicrobia bacterium]|jgi:beta-lactam-binding protein with PASTA domain|nr:PASTA domain-containing protein [Candidatus Neomarinimicrobiota bacterium]MDP6789362.1 PASTA domain-containing protein [Candidatus Neomarinimicrobiota bacterium]MDP7072730.1 PASTA domain-containing protein [Candidatus Neomarinimicrobiota bacterium]
MQSVIRTISALAVLSVIGVSIAEFVIMPAYVRHNKYRVVMDVRGKSLEKAEKTISSEGFRSVIQDTVYSNQYKPGIIVDQYPLPDTKVKPGRTIRLKVARPEKLVKVPNLIGQSKRSAELALQQANLNLDTIYVEYNPDFPNGTVAWQFPKGGDELKKWLGVQITISKGSPPDRYIVPQLFGLDEEKAVQSLKEARLLVGRISYQQNEDLLPFTVLDQSISAGTVTDRAVKVDLTVSVEDLQDIHNKLMND